VKGPNVKIFGRTALLLTAVLALLLAARGLPGQSDAAPDGKQTLDPVKKTAPDKTLTLDLGGGVTMKCVLIPEGKFMMGAKFTPAKMVKRYGGKEAHYADEHPRHEVAISKPFYMAACEVTQAQWQVVMNTQPWKGKVWGESGANYAASWLSWNEAAAFCKALSKKTGKHVTLPTEAQWEYACRSGTTTVFSFGDDVTKLTDHAWFHDNARKPGRLHAQPVGRKKPNPWGLYDMHGNVWEWCSDYYAKDFYPSAKNPQASKPAPVIDPENTTESKTRAVRGGSWYNDPTRCRSASRNSWTGPTYRHYNYGFRIIVKLK